MENQKGKTVKWIQSDNGTEYINNDFEKLLKKRGITRRLTVPYNPEQNGISERKNRTLLDMARCLLIESGLPSSFWAEAVNTANYLRNRCPSKSLNGKIPY
jgi:transposase InsO family protein